jgi:glutaminase
MSNAVPNLELVVREIAEGSARRPDRGEVGTYIQELVRLDAKALGCDRRRGKSRSRRRQRSFVLESKPAKVFTLTPASSVPLHGRR